MNERDQSVPEEKLDSTTPEVSTVRPSWVGRMPLANPSEDEHFLAWSVFNRDLSQLEFFKRLLEEAADESVPVLERLKFLAIFASNLDEFFMVRVSGLKEVLDIEVQLMPGELPPLEQLKRIRERVLPMVAEQMSCLRERVLPALARNGVQIVEHKSVTRQEKKALREYFIKNIFRVLT